MENTATQTSLQLCLSNAKAAFEDLQELIDRDVQQTRVESASGKHYTDPEEFARRVLNTSRLVTTKFRIELLIVPVVR